MDLRRDDLGNARRLLQRRFVRCHHITRNVGCNRCVWLGAPLLHRGYRRRVASLRTHSRQAHLVCDHRLAVRRTAKLVLHCVPRRESSRDSVASLGIHTAALWYCWPCNSASRISTAHLAASNRRSLVSAQRFAFGGWHVPRKLSISQRACLDDLWTRANADCVFSMASRAKIRHRLIS